MLLTEGQISDHKGAAMLLSISHDTILYRQRHRVKDMFGRFKDWRRIHSRYDRCAHTFFSVICIAATIIVWLPQ